MWLFTLACSVDGALFEYTLSSVAVDDDFRIDVFVPDGSAPEGGWPWMVVLDGDWLFEPATQRLSRMIRRGETEPGILVGVGYPGDIYRERDYLPEGLPAFYDFLEGELLPMIQAEHVVSDGLYSRSLYGHSYGGLAAVYGLLERPGAFGGYAAVSPSLWVDDGVAFSWLRGDQVEGLAYLAMGTLENGGSMAATFQMFTYELVENQKRVSTYVEWIAGARHETAAYVGFDHGAAWLLDLR